MTSRALRTVELGQSTSEYAFLLSLVAAALVGTFTVLGPAVGHLYDGVVNAMP